MLSWSSGACTGSVLISILGLLSGLSSPRPSLFSGWHLATFAIDSGSRATRASYEKRSSPRQISHNRAKSLFFLPGLERRIGWLSLKPRSLPGCARVTARFEPSGHSIARKSYRVHTEASFPRSNKRSYYFHERPLHISRPQHSFQRICERLNRLPVAAYSPAGFACHWLAPPAFEHSSDLASGTLSQLQDPPETGFPGVRTAPLALTTFYRRGCDLAYVRRSCPATATHQLRTGRKPLSRQNAKSYRIALADPASIDCIPSFA
jgi:hypothetical protein